MNNKRDITQDQEVAFGLEAMTNVEIALTNAEELLLSKQIIGSTDQKIAVAKLLLDESRFLIERYQSISEGEAFHRGN